MSDNRKFYKGPVDIYADKAGLRGFAQVMLENYKEQTKAYVQSSENRHPLQTYIPATVPDFLVDLLNSWGYQNVSVAKGGRAKTDSIPPHSIIVKGSVGPGQWADIPWVNIRDSSKAASTQSGIYVAYLLSPNSDELYLALCQGVQNSNPEQLRITRQEVLKMLDAAGIAGEFSRDTERMKAFATNHDYRKGCILYKTYHKNSLPSEGEMQTDLKNMLKLYDGINIPAPAKQVDNEEAKDPEGAHQSYDFHLDRIESDIVKLIDNGQCQIVLTGAPGTGKTRSAKRVADSYILSGNQIDDDVENCLYNFYVSLSGDTATRDTLEKMRTADGKSFEESMSDLLRDQSYYKPPLETLPEAQYFPPEIVDYVCKLLSYEKADFWQEAEACRGRLAMIQFHPSYDYTDFVEGLRPVSIEEDGPSSTDKKRSAMQFMRTDGSFMRFCRYVAWRNTLNEENRKLRYFFLIDEINRADLSKVLGELMFCLESDKRGQNNRVKTQYENLTTYFPNRDGSKYFTVFDNGFFIPENIVVIGTMNDIDRSVESVDFALRRRFVWKEVKVDDVLDGALNSGAFFSKLGLDDNVRKKVQALVISKVLDFNHTIFRNQGGNNYGLSSDYDISQGQFTNIPPSALSDDLNREDAKAVADAIMEWVWDYRVQSLLKEYLRGIVSGDDSFRKPDGELYVKWMQKKSVNTNTADGDKKAEAKADPAVSSSEI